MSPIAQVAVGLSGIAVTVAVYVIGWRYFDISDRLIERLDEYDMRKGEDQ